MSCPEQALSVNLYNSLTDFEVVRGVKRSAASVVDLGNENPFIAGVQRVARLALNATFDDHAELFVGRLFNLDLLRIKTLTLLQINLTQMGIKEAVSKLTSKY
jgi:hypothetical protein